MKTTYEIMELVDECVISHGRDRDREISRNVLRSAIDELVADNASLREQNAKLDAALAELEMQSAERDHARAQFQHAVRLLTGIHNLLYPAPIKLEDGRTMAFRPENPHEFMQALSDRIRALPDEIERAEHSPQGSDPWASHY